MALQDFTTYTEVDANGHLTVTASKAVGTDVGRDEDVYLFKFLGIDALDTLHITFELLINASSVPTTAAAYGGIAIANIVGTVQDFTVSDISAAITRETSGFKIFLFRGNAGDNDADNYVCSADTIYYCLLERVSGNDTVTLKIYSNPSKTILLDTLTITGVGATKYRYAYGFIGWNFPIALTEFDGYVENLDIAEAPTVTTQSVTGISGTTAVGNGSILSVGDASVTQHGHCWSLTTEPTISDFKTTNGAGSVASFESIITGLSIETKYFVRAYATNIFGTVYGNEVAFWSGLGSVFPIDAVTRVTSITYRYNRGIFNTVLGLGGLISDFDIPSVSDFPAKSYESKSSPQIDIFPLDETDFVLDLGRIPNKSQVLLDYYSAQQAYYISQASRTDISDAQRTAFIQQSIYYKNLFEDK